MDEPDRRDVLAWSGWANARAEAMDPMRHPAGMPKLPEPKADDLRPYLRGMSPYGQHGIW
jgi:hypothetical protein